MPRYKLRTLLIVLALGPPLLAGAWLAIQQIMRLRQIPHMLIEGGPPIEAFGIDYDPSRPLPPSPPVKRLRSTADDGFGY
jgi:hypothetical protein